MLLRCSRDPANVGNGRLRVRFAGLFIKPSDGLEPSTPSLPFWGHGNWSQPTATDFALLSRIRHSPICRWLRPVATAVLHKCSIPSCLPWLRTDARVNARTGKLGAEGGGSGRVRLCGGAAADRANEPACLVAIEHYGRGLAVPRGSEPDECGLSGGAHVRAVLVRVEDDRWAEFRDQRREGAASVRALLERAWVVAEEEVDLAAAGEALEGRALERSRPGTSRDRRARLANRHRPDSAGGRDGSVFRPASGAGRSRAAPGRARAYGRRHGRTPRRRRGFRPRAEARGRPGGAGQLRNEESGALPARAAGN
jgi:hypothetical protein